MVYEHDAAGNAIAGDLDELKMLVREGRTIQVGVRQLFGLVEDDLSGPEHISFAATVQPMISDGHVQSNCDLVVIGAPKWPIVWRDGALRLAGSQGKSYSLHAPAELEPTDDERVFRVRGGRGGLARPFNPLTRLMVARSVGADYRRCSTGQPARRRGRARTPPRRC